MGVIKSLVRDLQARGSVERSFFGAWTDIRLQVYPCRTVLGDHFDLAFIEFVSETSDEFVRAGIG